jgi:hypothetical protein
LLLAGRFVSVAAVFSSVSPLYHTFFSVVNT